LLAVNLARPIVAAAAAGAWLPPVAVAGLSVETGHGGVGCAAVAERRCPSSPTRQRYRVRVHQAAVAPSLDAGPVEKKGFGCGTSCGPPAGWPCPVHEVHDASGTW